MENFGLVTPTPGPILKIKLALAKRNNKQPTNIDN